MRTPRGTESERKRGERGEIKKQAEHLEFPHSKFLALLINTLVHWVNELPFIVETRDIISYVINFSITFSLSTINLPTFVA